MKRFACLILASLLCVSLFGCTWMEGEYTTVKPHQIINVQPDKNISEAFNYQELQNAVVDFVHNGDETAVLYISKIDQQNLDFYMDAIIQYVTEADAIGAYAVEAITYEYGTTAGKPALALKISYRRDRMKVIRMQTVDTMEDVEDTVRKALENIASECVVLVKNYQQTDCAELVRLIARDNPHKIMECPGVVSSVYPESGSERVIEFQLTYENSEIDLRTMQLMVEPVFAAAKLYVSGSRTDREKYAQLYAFLMERHEYKLESSVTPSYHLLHYGKGDSDAFAVVYSAMCRASGLHCESITGKKNGEDWSWNQIKIGDTIYYLDLLECEKNNGFALKTKADMQLYEWESVTEG